MSDSSLSDGPPSTAVLEQALRNAVRDVYRSGNLDNLTIKRIRKSVEADLDLQDDFFKMDSVWKERSKNTIQSEVDSHSAANANAKQPSSTTSPRPPSKSEKTQLNLPKPQKPNRDFRGTKRSSTDNAEPNKRQRKETPDSEGSASEVTPMPSKKPIPKPKKRVSKEKTKTNDPQPKENSGMSASGNKEEGIRSKKSDPEGGRGTPSVVREASEEASRISEDTSGSSKAIKRNTDASESEMSEVIDEAPTKKARKRKSDSVRPSSKANGAIADASDSEMSEVLDEAPKAGGRKRKLGSAKPRAKKTETLKSKKASDQSTDPDAEEIKRLQGWLIKCGIRKMWHRELAPYDNSKAKIRHLKGLLADAGMTGRYSMEKANQIKEERELLADLEAVQEGAKQWGKAESEVEDQASGRPKRRLAKGLQELNFLNDEDGEETD